MKISFKSKRVEKICNNDREAVRRIGEMCAKKLRQRLDDLDAVACLQEMKDNNIPGRCHELSGDRKGQLSLRLHGGMRLIFEPEADPPPLKEDGGLDWSRVVAITILEVADYHE